MTSHAQPHTPSAAPDETDDADEVSAPPPDLLSWLRDGAEEAASWSALSVMVFGRHRVYKLRRPIRLGGFDFRELAAREKSCQREVRVDGQLAPEIDATVVPLYRTDAGWSFEGTGDRPPDEFAIRMNRLPADRMLSARLADDGFGAESLAPVLDKLADFYAEARTGEKVSRCGAPAAVGAEVRAQIKGLRELLPEAEELDGVESALCEFLATHAAEFDARVAASRVRECHGDLRADHVCLCEPPVIFGSVTEKGIGRNMDVLADVAGLRVSLEVNGRPDLAAACQTGMARRLDEPADAGSLADFYAVHRAAGRARVHAERSQRDGLEPAAAAAAAADVLRHLAVASSHARRCHEPTLIVMVGLMGSGKSTLAQAVAAEIACTVVSESLVRAALTEQADGAADTRSPEFAARVDDAMLDSAAAALERGRTVVLDGSFLTARRRAAALAVARRLGVRPILLECRIAQTEAITRLDQQFRKDRTRRILQPQHYHDQAATAEPVEGPAKDFLVVLSTNKPVPKLVERVVQELRPPEDG